MGRKVGKGSFWKRKLFTVQKKERNGLKRNSPPGEAGPRKEKKNSEKGTERGVRKKEKGGETGPMGKRVWQNREDRESYRLKAGQRRIHKRGGRIL